MNESAVYEEIINLPDGTYIIEPDGYIDNYAERWAYGYAVGVGDMTLSDVTPGTIFGVWTEAGKRYFDVVKHVDALRDAKALAHKGQEKAIYDLRAEKVIYL